MNRSFNKPEILAPVGGSEQLLAAVRSGADAVYFGLQNFNARRNAENFAGEGLKDTIAYCRARNVKVYITINILVKDSELSEMQKAVDTAAEAGAARQTAAQIAQNAEGTVFIEHCSFAS